MSPELYFSPGEYLLGDKAYTLTKYMMTPYKSPAAERADNKRFNRCLSNIRVDIEHAFGILKGRWYSLNSLRVRLTTQRRYEFAIRWIMACVILHNLTIAAQDEWDDPFVDDCDDPEENEAAGSSRDRPDQTGTQKRDFMKNVVLAFQNGDSYDDTT